MAVLVTRYYGGIKLGAGGLVRAYGGAARDCLRAAPRATVRARARLQLRAPYELLGAVYNTLDRYQCQRETEEAYDDGGGAGGGMLLRVNVDACVADDVIAAVSDASSGRVVPAPAACDDDCA